MALWKRYFLAILEKKTEANDIFIQFLKFSNVQSGDRWSNATQANSCLGG